MGSQSAYADVLTSRSHHSSRAHIPAVRMGFRMPWEVCRTPRKLGRAVQTPQAGLRHGLKECSQELNVISLPLLFPQSQAADDLQN